MPIDTIIYSEFVEMFEPYKDFSGYEDDGKIEIEWEDVPCKNPARADDWCAFLWKPASEVYTGKYMRVEYTGSSKFAFWWCQVTDWNEDEVYSCGVCEERQDKEYSTCCEEYGLMTCEHCLKTYSGVCCRCVEENEEEENE